MYQNFKALSVSFKNTPLEIREKLALDEEMTERLLRFFKEFSSLSEILLISTCNRTEIYYSGDEITSLEIIKMLCIEKGLSNPDKLLHYFQPYHGTEAVEHLFRVALGLEAQVVGDLQITNQVKRAYQLSADYDMAGPFLHRLMHTIFFANKRVVQETAFRDGAASVSYAATELVEELTTHIINPKILVLGLGEIGADVC
ncbi:MAG: glutamyl-tRNA reductase, partial [Cyclobacteriaceae bacterium]